MANKPILPTATQVARIAAFLALPPSWSWEQMMRACGVGAGAETRKAAANVLRGLHPTRRVKGRDEWSGTVPTVETISRKWGSVLEAAGAAMGVEEAAAIARENQRAAIEAAMRAEPEPEK